MSLCRVSNRTQSHGFVNKSANFYSVNVLRLYATILVTLAYKVKTAFQHASTDYETGFREFHCACVVNTQHWYLSTFSTEFSK